MTGHSGKFLPRPTPETAEWWDACRNHELLVQKCSDCGNFQFYPRTICTKCLSSSVEWAKAAGTGEVITFTVVRRAVSEAYAADVPYVIALIRLQEGPVLMSAVEGCEPEDVSIGMPVEVLFEEWSEDITMPKFRPVDQ